MKWWFLVQSKSLEHGFPVIFVGQKVNKRIDKGWRPKHYIKNHVKPSQVSIWWHWIKNHDQCTRNIQTEESQANKDHSPCYLNFFAWKFSQVLVAHWLSQMRSDSNNSFHHDWVADSNDQNGCQCSKRQKDLQRIHFTLK